MFVITVPVKYLSEFIIFCSQKNLVVKALNSKKAFLAKGFHEGIYDTIPVMMISHNLSKVGRISFEYNTEMEEFIQKYKIDSTEDPISKSAILFQEFLDMLKKQSSPLCTLLSEIQPDEEEQL